MRLGKIIGVTALGTLAALASVGGQAANAAQGRFVVQFNRGMEAQGRAAIAAAGGSVKTVIRGQRAVSADIPVAALARVSGNPAVKDVEEDARRYPISAVRALPSGADRGMAEDVGPVPQVEPYGVPMVQADQLTPDPQNAVKVCVIDSGYDLGHEDKAGSDVVTGTDDLAGAGPWSEDGDGHGTHVSGTISALDNDLGIVGVYPNAPMHIVRVFGNDGLWAYSSDLVNAVGDCISNGATVINMSLGGELPSRLENAVFRQAELGGILSIAAAGNGGTGRVCDLWADPSRPERQACKSHYPAAYNSVVSVAAVDANSVVAEFSQRNSKVELAAPGVSVLSTVPTDSMMDVTLDSGIGATTVVPMDNFDIPTSPVTGNIKDCGLATTAADCGDATGQICLIERGSVTFAEKAVSCQAAGGIAAVVFQRAGVDGPVLGTLGTTHVDIPVVGMDRESGLALRTGQVGTSATLSFVLSHYDYDYFNGTSMATPHVAGVAALVWSNHGECSNTEIRAALAATAIDLGNPGRDHSYGNGLVQAKAASDYLDAHPCTGN